SPAWPKLSNERAARYLSECNRATRTGPIRGLYSYSPGPPAVPVEFRRVLALVQPRDRPKPLCATLRVVPFAKSRTESLSRCEMRPGGTRRGEGRSVAQFDELDLFWVRMGNISVFRGIRMLSNPWVLSLRLAGRKTEASVFHFPARPALEPPGLRKYVPVT